jgi:hypothetical protein
MFLLIRFIEDDLPEIMVIIRYSLYIKNYCFGYNYFFKGLLQTHRQCLLLKYYCSTPRYMVLGASSSIIIIIIMTIYRAPVVGLGTAAVTFTIVVIIIIIIIL